MPLLIAAFTSSTAMAHTAARIDAVVLDEMAKQNIVGMAVGVIRNGRIYHAGGYGHADLARTIPVTPDTLFRWGSVSKTLTAVAALKLAELNPAFSLDDKVTEHVSYWPEHGNKANIRIEHLLSNRSGIVHYKKKKRCPGNRSPGYSRRRHTSRIYDARQAVEVFRDQRLCFDPGTRYKYSTFGYSLLGSAIEGGSGTGYTNWVRKTIKRPLGMSSLRQAAGVRHGFDQQCHILQQVDAGNAAWKLPGGGWESNIIDLAKFANALLQGSLLENTSRLSTTVPGNPNYGYGIKYTPDKRQVWHEGKHDNSRALLYLYPGSKDSLGIVLMINGIHSQPVRIAHHLANLFGRHHDDSTAPVIKNCKDPCPGMFSAVWHRTGRDALLRRGYGHDTLYAERRFLREAGYYADDIEPYVKGGRVYWDAVFRKGTGDTALLHETGYDRFRNRLDELSREGYSLIDLETYTVDGIQHWTGLFRPVPGEYALLAGMTSGELAARQRQLAARGLGLIDIEAYSSNGALYWAGVWRAGEDVLFNYNLNSRDFATLQNKRRHTGYRLTDIESYPDRNRQLLAGIWEKSTGGYKWASHSPFCDSEYVPGALNSKGITQRHNEWREQGYELIDWESH